MSGQWRNQRTRAVAIWLGVTNLSDEVTLAIGRQSITQEEREPKDNFGRLPWARHKRVRDILAGALKAHAMRHLVGKNEVEQVLLEATLMEDVDFIGIAEVLLDKMKETVEAGQCVIRENWSTSAGPGEAD